MDKIIEDFKMRFNKALLSQAMKPVELSEKTGISKSTISHYMSGYTKPKSDKLYVLAKALDVNETWLMGYDVPMERNNYEDPTLLKRDAELEDIEKILEDTGYSLCCDNNDADYFLIKNTNNQTVIGFYDYELLSRYESLKKKGEVTAETLLSTEHTFLKYLESLGYHLYRDDPEHKPFMSSKNRSSCRLEYDTLDNLKLRIDSYAKATVDSELLSLKEEEIRKERLEKERTLRHLRGENIYKGSQFEKDRDKSYLEPQAAHERTDIDVTDEMRKHDDDIMNDDDFWK